MPAPRNDRERNRIYEGAVALFMERGYAKTAYKDIAAACDTTKSMVQHYFPRKEMIAERFFRERLDEFMGRALELMPASYTQLDLLTCVGLLHYDFILNDPQTSGFCADLLESRSLTNRIIGEQYEWASGFLKDATPDGTTAKAQFYVALGGAYDLMYQASNGDTPQTAGGVQLAAMLAFWLPMGLTAEEVNESVRRAQELTGVQ